MGLFGKGRPKDGSNEGQVDDALPFRTVEDAVEVRRLAQRAFAEAGVEVVVHPDCLEATDGRVFGLWNLAATCHNADGGRREWSDLVRRHVQALVTPSPTAAELSPEQLLEGTYLRVYGADSIPPQSAERLSYARAFADDLMEALVLDSPESVSVLLDDDVAHHDLDALRRAGLENLLREPIDEIQTVDAGQGSRLHVVLGDSVYTASRILALRDLLGRVFGERQYPDGVLVAAPFRHQVVLHPIDGPEAIAAVNGMVRFASLGYRDSAGSVSPNVYWWHAGTLTRISHEAAGGGVTVEVGPELSEVFNRLAGGSR